MNISAPDKDQDGGHRANDGPVGPAAGFLLPPPSSSSQRRPEEVPRERPALLWSSSRRPPVRTAFTWAVLRDLECALHRPKVSRQVAGAMVQIDVGVFQKLLQVSQHGVGGGVAVVGLGTMARMVMASSASRDGGGRSPGESGMELICWMATETGVSPQRGRRPVIISYRTTPAEYRSERASM